MENLNAAAGAGLRHVPYEGEQPLLQDLLGGHIDTALLTLTASIVAELQSAGFSPAYRDAQAFARFIDKESSEFAERVRRAGLNP